MSRKGWGFDSPHSHKMIRNTVRKKKQRKQIARSEAPVGVFTGIACDQCGQHEQIKLENSVPAGWYKLQSFYVAGSKEYVLCGTKCLAKWSADKKKEEAATPPDPDSYCREHCAWSEEHQQMLHDQNCPKGKAYPQ